MSNDKIPEEHRQRTETNRVRSSTATVPELEASEPRAYAALKKPFILALVLQFVLLTYSGCFHMYVLAAGQTVLLKTIPVDPWDVFRGNYLALRYDISSIKTKEDFKLGQDVYVVLQKQDRYWTVNHVSHTMPKLTSNQVALRGMVDGNLEHEIEVHYGLEQYFAPEGKAVLPRGVTPEVEVAVDQFGNSTIKQLVSHGKKIEF